VERRSRKGVQPILSMAKITLTDIANISGNPATAENSVNNNNQSIETALENTLSRDGTSPNQMEANLDMNQNRILNLPAPINGTEPLRLADASAFLEVEGTLLPPQVGHAGEFLGTNGSALSWSSPAVSGAIIAALAQHLVPKGVILMWSGNSANIPSGWALCDGTNVVGFGITPDLRNRFIVGATGTYSPGETGGATSAATNSAGGHTPVVNDATLTEAQIPLHGHRLFAWNTNSSDGALDGFAITGFNISVAGELAAGGALITANGQGTRIIEQTGGGLPHGHTAVTVPNHSHTVNSIPPYYALCYIVKVTGYV
jgi:microcystin-dependent protein